uniref:Uncharacterized protein n=1 Tax=viral metagenome TaxID=1070528 RepID=A0A6M3KA84_9ZZZZ
MIKIDFIASLPDIQSAINISGNGAVRVKLDIPESEIADAIKLVMLKGKAFKVNIETIEEENWGVADD